MAGTDWTSLFSNLKSGSSSSSKGPTFAPGQAAIYTPDPTLGGDWTHTRADTPLFKNAPAPTTPATTPKPGTSTRPGTGSGGFDWSKMGGLFGGGGDQQGSAYSWLDEAVGPGKSMTFRQLFDMAPDSVKSGFPWNSSGGTSGSTGSTFQPDYSYYGVPPSAGAASGSSTSPATTPPATSPTPPTGHRWPGNWHSSGQSSNPAFQQWKQLMQQWQGGQSSNPVFQPWRELLAKALERD